jgi:N-methylhydantoinase A
MFEVVCEQMAAAARAHATDRGVDYRGLPLLAFGGAGPIHACRVAELLDASTVIYPPMASVLSAFGTLVSPVRLDLVRGALSRLAAIDWAEVDRLIDAMEAEGRAALAAAGIPDDRVGFAFAVDLRYVGQQSEVTVQVARDPRLAHDAEELAALFGEAYERLYGLRLDMAVEIVSWRLTALGPEPERSPRIALAALPARPIATREVLVGDGERQVPVYRRTDLGSGDTIAGPVIVEERETTIFVLPDWTLSVHPTGALFARRAA